MVSWSTGRCLPCSEWMFRYLFLVESVVKRETVVFYVLGNAVHFEFRFMHADLWVRRRNRVYFAVLLLFLEDGALPHADGELSETERTLF